DLSGEGRLLLAVANVRPPPGSPLLPYTTLFRPAPLAFAVGASPFSLAVGDFNGDGKPDLVAANYDSNTISVLINTGTVTAQPNYTVSASPSSLTITQGGSGTSTITLTPRNGFSGSVSLSASGLPSGVTASFSPNPATTTSTLTLTASSTA